MVRLLLLTVTTTMVEPQPIPRNEQFQGECCLTMTRHWDNIIMRGMVGEESPVIK